LALRPAPYDRRRLSSGVREPRIADHPDDDVAERSIESFGVSLSTYRASRAIGWPTSRRLPGPSSARGRCRVAAPSGDQELQHFRAMLVRRHRKSICTVPRICAPDRAITTRREPSRTPGRTFSRQNARPSSTKTAPRNSPGAVVDDSAQDVGEHVDVVQSAADLSAGPPFLNERRGGGVHQHPRSCASARAGGRRAFHVVRTFAATLSSPPGRLGRVPARYVAAWPRAGHSLRRVRVLAQPGGASAVAHAHRMSSRAGRAHDRLPELRDVCLIAAASARQLPQPSKR
jgi:hypothetical protein